MLETYLDKTKEMRNDSSNLFISLYKPYGSLSTVSVRNSFVSAMKHAGIDVSKFSPHSSRSSSTAVPGLTLQEILAMGCWKRISTFHRYYEADLLPVNEN